MATIDDLDRKYGIGKPILPSQSQGQTQGPTGLGGIIRGASNIMGGLGLGAIPQALGETVGMFTGRKVQPNNPFMSPQQMSQIKQNIPENTLGNALGMASWMIPGGEVSKAANPLLKAGLNTAGRFAAGAGIGGLQQAGSNMQQGKPISQNVPQTAAEAGGVNAVLPGIAGLAKGVLKSTIGSSKGIYNRIAEFMVGSGQDVNPDVKNSLVFQDKRDPQTGDILQGGHYWQQSIKNLADKAQEIYAPLQKELAQTQTTVGDFYKTFTNNGERIFDPKEMKAVNNGLLQAADSAQTLQAKDALLQLRGIVNSTLPIDPNRTSIGITPIAMDAINEFKKNIPYNDDTKDLYRSVQKFVENQVGKDTPTGKINQRYNDLKIAIDNITNRFADKSKQTMMESGMGWMQRIAMVIGAGIVGGAAGLPSGSMYAGPTVGGAAYVGSALKDALLKSPQRADAYAKVLQPIEKAGGGLQQLLQKVAPRLPGMTQ